MALGGTGDRTAVVDLYTMLELEAPHRRRPPPSNALFDDVAASLQAMQNDPAQDVALNAKSMLAYIAKHRR
jgi:hypothetical protein